MVKRYTIEDLIALTIPEVQEIFLRQMQDVVDNAILSEMVRAIEMGDAEALFTATGFTPAVLGPILDRIEALYGDTANLTVDGFPNRIRTPTGLIVFRFNMRNPVVEKELRENSTRLVSNLMEDARGVVRSTLERGMIEGLNPKTTALDIIGRIDPTTKQRVGGVIGLTTNQEKWVVNAERYLKTFDEKYFSLELRDKRFDKIVRSHFDAGKKPPSNTIQKAVTAYKTRALRYRGEVIARTETLNTVQMSKYRVHKQLVEEGKIPQNAIKKWWNAVGDRRTRPSHNIMEVTTRKIPIDIDEPFVSPSGARLMHPGDRSLGAPAKETIQCRCMVEFKVDWSYDLED